MAQSINDFDFDDLKPKKSFNQIKGLIDEIIQKPKKIQELKPSDLIDICLWASASYRSGNPVVEDDFYDHFLIKELSQKEPNHPLISEVEDDYQSFGTQKVSLPEPMLSTQKAYAIKPLELFLDRIDKKAKELNVNFANLEFRLTVKLDGFAAYFDGNRLITRGNGVKGTDISRALDRGLSIYQNSKSKANSNHGKDKITGAGEIVVKKSYFNQYLINDFIHPRNFVASVIKEKQLDQKTQKAIDAKAVLFIPFSELEYLSYSANALIDNLDKANKKLTQEIDFEFDGLVIELSGKDQIHQKIKAEMGSTLHHHRWQIAYKKNTEKAKSSIIDISPQTGRTGKITPVATISPLKLSGATISRVSAHNYDFVQKLEIGKGAKVEIVRSGEVIPKIITVIKPAEKVELPKNCPSCKTNLIWQTKFLICPNHHHCPDQIKGNLNYFFVSLDNLDGFGPATIKTFYDFGIRKVSEIYQLTETDLEKMGYQPKTRNNLLTELEKSKQLALEDWRFLSAFGIERLGTAASIKLLENYSLSAIFELKIDDLIQLDGFAHITAQAMVEGLKAKKDEIKKLQNQFNLILTEIDHQQTKDLPLSNLNICFTGKMQANRNEMQTNARKLGAKVVGSISKNTHWLVVGENAGANKLERAKKLGVKVLSEKEYFKKITT